MLACNAGCRAEQVEEEPELSTVEVSTVGMDLLTSSPVVLLRQPESGQVVPIWVGLGEAQAIMRALHGLQTPRPMTHDLMGSLLSHLDVTVVAVVVHELRGGTYYGRVQLKRAGEDKIIDVDSRPSDAIALALRTKSPVRVARKLLTEVPCFEFVPPEGPQQVVRLLGLTVVSATEEFKAQHELADRAGVAVLDVEVSAAKHGMQAGDLILEINGTVVSTPMEFYEEVLATPRGAPVRVRLLRKDEEQTVEIPWEPSATPRPGTGRESFRA
jgi:bifunctional DNase/RNase